MQKLKAKPKGKSQANIATSLSKTKQQAGAQEDGVPVPNILQPVKSFYSAYLKQHPDSHIILCNNFGLNISSMLFLFLKLYNFHRLSSCCRI